MEGLKGEFFSFSCSFCPLVCDFLEEPGVAFTLGFRGTRAGGSKVLEVTEVAVDTLYTTHWGIVEETSTASPRVVLRRAHRELAGGLHFFMSGSANCGLDRNVYIVVLGIILGLGLLPVEPTTELFSDLRPLARGLLIGASTVASEGQGEPCASVGASVGDSVADQEAVAEEVDESGPITTVGAEGRDSRLPPVDHGWAACLKSST
eukprot:CAMPEP_0206552434 /NCGR_PEP_ID=MMETSP0325_2-20121206/16085_1 /ASSEMBLY_ACC=CAM_ASM_000347 /TAXON_ID=2866 /ORGANISM="Crypthecodinium cohnii, Strain Seligo" /LENGTH=205 /DNA_ID=CAMNT_0054052321 /DNA_START=230 /DNA_END=848 /DNA_ORIENTATION=-